MDYKTAGPAFGAARFPFSEVKNIHVTTETHRYGSVVPAAHSFVVSRIRAVAGVIVSVRPKRRSLVGFPHEISSGVNHFHKPDSGWSSRAVGSDRALCHPRFLLREAANKAILVHQRLD